MTAAPLALLAGCYLPPDLPPFDGVPIEAAPPEGCRPDDEISIACTIDGDTFDRGLCGDGGERFRMLGIDAPETEKPGVPADCFADAAWDWLTDLIDGEDVTVSYDQTCIDVYGRTLAYVWIRGELYDDIASDPIVEHWLTNWYQDADEPAILVNEMMLGEGYARQYPEEIAGTLVFQDRLDGAAREAEQFDRGLWGACEP